MAAQIITAAAELDLLPVGSVILDAEGCAWQKWDDTERCDDGGDRLPVVWASTAYTDDWTSEELATKTMGLMGRPVGPFRLTYRPDAESEPQRVQPSRDDVARILFDLSGTCATYGEQADAILALCAAQPTVAEVRAQALRDYAASRYEAYLEDPTVPWPDQPSRMAQQYAMCAAELRAAADREAEGGAQ